VNPLRSWVSPYGLCAAVPCTSFNFFSDSTHQTIAKMNPKISSSVASFTSSIFEKLVKENPSENIFFSAFSLSSALSMTAAGAKGTTENEMLSALKIDIPSNELHPAFGALTQSLTNFQGDSKVQLSIANKLWVSQKLPLESAFLEITQKHYVATAQAANFEKAPEEERVKINLWAEENTNGKIQNLLPSGSIAPDTELVLTNAIYFKADWVRSFQSEKTRKAEFTTGSGTKVEASMMNAKGTFLFSQQTDYKALEKPYSSPTGKNFSAVFILPEEPGVEGIQKAIKALIPDRSGKTPFFLTQMFEMDVTVSIPKFKIEFSFEASKPLKELGMKSAFAGGDFSGISKSPLTISQVFHKAFVDVNEEGTEAAAATAVVMMRSMAVAKQITFIADRPFIFLIWDRASQTILFSGLVSDPTK
jgi:serpin B